MLKNYFTIAVRNLSKNVSQSIINITGLSIGMAVAVMIILWVKNELTYDNYHEDSDRIYRITHTLQESDFHSELSPFILAETVKKEFPEIENTAIMIPVFAPPVFNFNGQLYRGDRMAYVNPDWLNVFHYEFLAGSKASFFSDPYNILLTETAAAKYFDKTEAIGKIINIDSVDYTVRAIVKDNPSNSSFRFDVLVPVASAASDPGNAHWFTDWGASSSLTFLKLHQSTDVELTEKKLTGIFMKNFQWATGSVYSLLPLSDIHFEKLNFSNLDHGEKRMVPVFSVLAFLLLFTACINYVNLITAKASHRTKEISIRKISGARRMEIFWQFFMETTVVSIIALFIAVVFIQVCLPAFNQFTERKLEFLSDPTGIIILIGTLVFVILFSSIYPALLLSTFGPVQLFRKLNIFSVQDAILRKALVIAQFTISIILIISIIIIYKQQAYIRNTGEGYDRSQIFSFIIPADKLLKMKKEQGTVESLARQSWLKTFKEELNSDPRISAISFASDKVDNADHIFYEGPYWDGKGKDADKPTGFIRVDPDFAGLFNVEISRGRWFSDEFYDKNSYVINETAARELNIPEPLIGRELSLNNVKGRIVGVAKDFHYRSLHEKIGPLLMANSPDWYTYVYIKTTPGNTASALKAAETIFKKFIPEQPFEYTFMDESFDRLYKSDNETWILLKFFTGIILFVSCMGIFGLAAYGAEQRRKEIGIRKVLGATVPGITALLSKDFVKLVLIAVLVASPVAWYIMNKWLQDFVYRIPIQWWMFAVGGMLALLIAVVTVSLQAIKAALANPVSSLRSE